LNRISIITHIILLAWTVFTIFPIFPLILAAFTGKLFFLNLTLSDFSLDFFEKVIAVMGNAYFNSLITAVGAVAINIPSCALAGFAFARFKFRGKMQLYSTLMIIQSVPIVSGIIGILFLFKSYGLVNNLAPLAIMGAVSTIPINTWFAHDYFRRLPKDLEESAEVDGASKAQAFSKITLPLATPLLVTMGLMTFISTWNEFILANILITRKSLFTYPIALLAFGTEATTSPVGTYHWGYLAAGSLLGLLPILAASIFLRKFLIEGLTRGALKA